MKKSLIIPCLFFLFFSINQFDLFSNVRQKSTYLMPLWVDYSRSVPDSVRDFLKIYFQTKGISILTMQQALEMIFDQENANLSKILNDPNTTEGEIAKKMENSRKPVCNYLSIELYNNNISDRLISDSIKWFVLQKASLDTFRHYHTFFPINNNDTNPYMLWRNFADTILASGLLK